MIDRVVVSFKMANISETGLQDRSGEEIQETYKVPSRQDFKEIRVGNVTNHRIADSSYNSLTHISDIC